MEIAGIPIRIERKKVKYLRVRIIAPDAQVRVSAPLRCSKAAILDFLIEKQEWIISTRQKILKSQKLPDLFGENEAIVWLWGKCYFFQPTPPAVSTDKESLQGCYQKLQRQILGAKLVDLVKLWESRLGVQSQEIKIRKMKTRWGSCNHQARRIWFNLELVRYPLEAVELVVVHELIHLLYAHHGDEFYRLLAKQLPDWKKRKQLLQQYFSYQS